MATSSPTKPTHLDPSPLGTKEYWDNLYTTEITNYAQDPTDEGTIWFEDSAAEDKVLEFLEEKIENERVLGEGVGEGNCAFLDLGTGNGHFLFRLRDGKNEEGDEEEENGGEGGWEGRLMGVDYSSRSIEFALQISAEKKAKETEGREIEFKHWDLMTAPSDVVLNGEQTEGWDVVLDKGTFDAISLSEEKDARGRRIVEGYRERVFPLIREGGLLLITSCNWTEEELEAWFVGGGEGGNLEVMDKIHYRSFSFGGRKGQTISSVCFRKRGRGI